VSGLYLATTSLRVQRQRDWGPPGGDRHQRQQQQPVPIRLNAGEFFTITVTQTSGVPLGFNGFESATMTWLGSLT